MSFAHLSGASVLAGLAVLASVLFLLQRLRVRHREITVITTQFWREATEEAQARVFVDRFRHPLAYLFVLLIGALLWIGVAGPRRDGGDGRDHALLLDASAAMAWPGRFDAAQESLLATVAALPRNRTTVVLCGARPRTLLLPGENALLLEERLRGSAPDACPETITRTIRDLAATANEGSPLAIRVFGDAPLPMSRIGLLPDAVDVVRDEAPSAEGTNTRITTLGVTAAASGSWTHVDILVGATGARISATLDGIPLDGIAVEANGASTDGLTIFRDVPANGATFSVVLDDGGAVTGDDRASVILPRRSLLTVSLPRDAPAALRRALVLDPAVKIVESDALVVITRDADTIATARAGLLLSDQSGGGAAFVVHGTATEIEAVRTSTTDPRALRDALRDLALDQIDATSLATDAGRAIELAFRNDGGRYIEVWESLFTDAFDFTRQRAFPLFVARAVRRAAAIEDIVPLVAAGETLPPHWGPLTDTEGHTLNAADGALRAFEAGVHTTATGKRLHVASLYVAPPATAADEQVPDAPSPGGVPFDLALLAGLAGTALLCGEWLLYRAGRMP